MHILTHTPTISAVFPSASVRFKFAPCCIKTCATCVFPDNIAILMVVKMWSVCVVVGEGSMGKNVEVSVHTPVLMRGVHPHRVVLVV